MTTPALSASPAMPSPRPPKVRIRAAAALFDPAILRRAVVAAFIKLNPRAMIRIPVMFVVEIGSVITTIEFIDKPSLFVGLVTLWLWATVLFANFAEAVAEGRGKAQADTLRKARKDTMAHRVTKDGTLETIPSMGTTAGATDSALDSYTPVGGTAAFAAILLGEISPGGDGGGLYAILILALLSVFIAGLMVGRTPEFLGKKIRAPQMKLVVAYVLTIPIVVLVFGSISLVISPGTSSILNPGMHGLTEITYAYASVAQNNGSAFAGLSANTPWYDITLGLSMLIGRFAPIVLALAVAGSLAGARVHARTRATLDTAGLTFAGFLVGVIVIVGGLIYFPMLILGPIGERITG